MPFQLVTKVMFWLKDNWFNFLKMVDYIIMLSYDNNNLEKDPSDIDIIAF